MLRITRIRGCWRNLSVLGVDMKFFKRALLIRLSASGYCLENAFHINATNSALNIGSLLLGALR
jgi:hypothetical protein